MAVEEPPTMPVSDEHGPNGSPKRRTPRRTISSTRRYSMVYDDVFREIAQDPDLPLWRRVSFWAMSRANQIGHAEFAKGELQALTGEKYGNNVSRAVTTAVKKGWLAEGSGIRCATVPAHRQHRGVGSAKCVTCGIGYQSVIVEVSVSDTSKPNLRLLTSEDAESA